MSRLGRKRHPSGSWMVRGWKTVLKKFEGTPRSGTADTHGFCIFNGSKLDRVVRDKCLWNLNENSTVTV